MYERAESKGFIIQCEICLHTVETAHDFGPSLRRKAPSRRNRPGAFLSDKTFRLGHEPKFFVLPSAMKDFVEPRKSELLISELPQYWSV